MLEQGEVEMKTTLVIMAAGIGFPLWRRNQTAGAGQDCTERSSWIIPFMMRWKRDLIRLIFIIRKDIEEAFREAIGDRIEKICAASGCGSSICISGAEKTLPAGVVLSGRTERSRGEPVRQYCACRDDSYMSRLQLSMQMIIMEKKHL